MQPKLINKDLNNAIDKMDLDIEALKAIKDLENYESYQSARLHIRIAKDNIKAAIELIENTIFKD